jgi:uncharacterized RDD family membrane protein YckC
MSDVSQGPGWWLASDGKWYAPEQHPNYVAPPPTPAPPATPTPPPPTPPSPQPTASPSGEWPNQAGHGSLPQTLAPTPAPAPAPPPVFGAGQPGAGPPGLYLDQASGLMLPHGVVLAGVGRRIGAYFLAIPLAIVTLGLGYVIWGLIVWGRGQTPTFQVLGMRCWRPETGRVASWWWMALREIVGRFLEGILAIISALVSFILMLTSKERKSLHDMIAGTVVLHDPNNVLTRTR